MKSKYTHSAHCVYNIGYHLIWCTKYRKKLIYGEIETYLKLLRLFPRLRRKWGAPVLWSKSYFCESVGHISQDTIQRYIKLQKQRQLAPLSSAG